MKKNVSCFLSLCLSAGVALAQTNTGNVKEYGDQIKAEQLKEYLTIIASDALEGRRTGTRGQKMAAAFISNHFQEIGLKGSCKRNVLSAGGIVFGIACRSICKSRRSAL